MNRNKDAYRDTFASGDARFTPAQMVEALLAVLPRHDARRCAACAASHSRAPDPHAIIEVAENRSFVALTADPWPRHNGAVLVGFEETAAADGPLIHLVVVAAPGGLGLATKQEVDCATEGALEAMRVTSIAISDEPLLEEGLPCH